MRDRVVVNSFTLPRVNLTTGYADHRVLAALTRSTTLLWIMARLPQKVSRLVAVEIGVVYSANFFSFLQKKWRVVQVD